MDACFLYDIIINITKFAKYKKYNYEKTIINNAMYASVFGM